MWNKLKRIGEVMGILTVPRLRERHVVRLSKALDKAVNEVERLQAELKNTKGLLEFARVALNEALAQLAQAEIDLADKAFYVREFAAVSQERDGLKAELAAIIEATEQDGCDTALEAVKQLREHADTVMWREAYSDDAFEALKAALQRAKDHNQTITEGYKEEIAALRERAEQAEAERDDLQYENPIIRELRAILGLKLGESITERCKELAALRERAAVPVPAGVPSVEELAELIYNHVRTGRNYATSELELKAAATAIRDAVLAGVGQPSSNTGQLPADEVEALARVLHDATNNIYVGGWWVPYEQLETTGTHGKRGLDAMARAAIAHLRKRPEGLPTAEELGMLGIDVYGKTGCHTEMADAILDALAPYLRDPVGWDLDVTAQQIITTSKEAHDKCCETEDGINKSDWEVACAVLDLCRSRIRPAFECKECARLKQRLNYAGDAWRRIVGYEANDALTDALESNHGW